MLLLLNRRGTSQIMLERLDLGPHGQPKRRIEIGERFVEEEELRLLDQGACERHPLLLTPPTARSAGLREDCPLRHLSLMRPATAGVRIVLKVLGGGICRPRAHLSILSHAQGCARRFVQMQAPARPCCQLRACMATGYRNNLLDHIGGLGCGPR